MDILQTITKEFNLHPTHAQNIVALLDEGNTVPFIARYRKEMTGSCDDQVLRELNDRLTYLRNLQKRRNIRQGSGFRPMTVFDMCRQQITGISCIVVKCDFRQVIPRILRRVTIGHKIIGFVVLDARLDGFTVFAVGNVVSIGQIKEARF